MSYLYNNKIDDEKKIQELFDLINKFQSSLIGSPLDQPFVYNNSISTNLIAQNVEFLLSTIRQFYLTQTQEIEYEENEIESKRLDLFYSFLINYLETYK
jgi:hypothetical protein